MNTSLPNPASNSPSLCCCLTAFPGNHAEAKNERDRRLIETRPDSSEHTDRNLIETAGHGTARCFQSITIDLWTERQTKVPELTSRPPGVGMRAIRVGLEYTWSAVARHPEKSRLDANVGVGIVDPS